jgi:cytochrome oxidase Cu insertion factor (SCO1/SenC/PrrC family)
MIQLKNKKIIVSLTGLILFYITTYGQPVSKQGTNERHLTVHLRGVFDAKIKLTPYEGLKAIKTIAEQSGVKRNETATLVIPEKYLPGEFVLRIDYRSKESDSPYPAERSLYINKQDIEIFVNPPYINNSDSTKLNSGEKENTVYAAFIKENNNTRKQLDLLRQVLLGYDRTKSDFFKQGVKEFENRRNEFNQWLKKEAKTYKELYVSKLFQFQYIPSVEWVENKMEQPNEILKSYFDGIDFNDTIIIHSREMAKLMDDYMGLYSMQATTKELRDSLFTQAGSFACEKASKGNSKVYGWMVDYFYIGYESYGLDKGTKMLQKHIDNPNCLTSKKQEIIKRLEGMKKLVPEAKSPNFILMDNKGNKFDFHSYKGKAPFKLLLFWSASCEHCQQFVNSFSKWYNDPENKDKIDVVAISVDETEAEVKKWENIIGTLPGWIHLHAKEGVNSQVANDYDILGTPTMFLIESESNIIKSVPKEFEELIKNLGNK